MKMICPKTEAALAEFVAGADGPLAVTGGGTQGMSLSGTRVSSRGLSGVELYEPGALTLVVQSGTPVSEIEALLAEENQQLAFEPRDMRGLMGMQGDPTIGGVFATNLSGPRRIQAGAARDFLLGVRYVDGAGQCVKNGGRVMKNVTGYDLVKLMAGSHGTLGILTEVALKVLPRPETVGTLRIVGLTPVQAVVAMSKALGSPYDVTGAAHIPGTEPVTLIRLEGFELSVQYRMAELQAVLAEFGEAQAEMGADVWRDVRDVKPLHAASGNIWRISVKPSDAPEVLAQLEPEAAMMDWGGGLILAALPGSRDARVAMEGVAGHATLLRGDGFPRFHPEPAPVAKLANDLRAKFDPRGILNPDLMR